MKVMKCVEVIVSKMHWFRLEPRTLYERRSYASRYRRENARRRHNYLPFIVEILRILAKEGRLVPMVEKVGFSQL